MRGIVGALVLGLLLGASSVAAEESADPMARLGEQLRVTGLNSLGAYRYLEQLTAIGPRLGGSPEAAKAVALTHQMMLDLGLSDVHLEEVTVGHWVRGTEVARIVDGPELSVCALGGSVGTPVDGVTGRVIEVQSLEECDALGDRAKGKVIFFNRPMDPTLLDTFHAYGGAADQRVHGASRAAAVGAVAVLTRSLTLRPDDVPHTGVMRYAEGQPKIPAAAISLVGAQTLHEALEQGPVTVHLELGCKTLAPVVSHNVVGQLTGTEVPGEVVVLGGHLDSWDKGTGAHDDGAGCMQAMEAMRLLKKTGFKPRRTLRVVMYMDEEFGGTGGKAYAAADRRNNEKHVAAMESDRGGFLPIGITVRVEEKDIRGYQQYLPLFRPLGIQWIRVGYGGVDINPLHESGTVTTGLYPDSQRYFDVHHCANDVIGTVNPRELELGAVVMALWGAVLANREP